MNVYIIMQGFLRDAQALPEHSEHKNGRNERDKGGGVSSGVHLLEVGEVGRLKWGTKTNMDSHQCNG